MLKKWSIAILLCVTSILIFAHDVVPHFNHDQFVCFPITSLSLDSDFHAGEDNSEHHEHDHGCLLLRYMERGSNDDGSAIAIALPQPIIHEILTILLTTNFNLQAELSSLKMENINDIYINNYKDPALDRVLPQRAPPFLA